MSDLSVRDYLQTQGLKLPEDDVRVAQVAARFVMDSGNAAIERALLWYVNDDVVLAEHISENEQNEVALKQVFMALDSVFERTMVKSAVVYALAPDELTYLVRLAQQGEVIEQKVSVDEENGWHYLFVRSAQTGWLNVVDDAEHWLEQGELKGLHNMRCLSQMSLPICLPSGRVLGVLHVEAEQKSAFDDAAQAEWVGLALALVEPLRVLLHMDNEIEDSGDM
ncbi:GAF domain-containing protein [Neisseria wadsworthii]|uniref:GAF domain-containing protein n=1 Tax=Neisseria wadsworthii TaxID=607711 RepID=UPI000D31DFBA|nr:GAF domain-containing protein [Neisseria wadsworthii]